MVSVRTVLISLKRQLCRVFCDVDRATRHFRRKHPETLIVWPERVGTFYSQEGQDLYLASLLLPLVDNSPEAPVFLDIGCNHPEKLSNSLFFEKYLGFRTIAIDPLGEYAPLWREQRPGARFENVGLAETPGEMQLHVPKATSQRDDMFSFFGDHNRKTESCELESRTIPVLSLKQLAEKQGLSEVMVCSIDVEGFELEVLKGIDFDQMKIVCFCIENDMSGLYGDDSIRDFLHAKDYVFLARIGHRDDVFLHRSICGRALLHSSESQ